jgi:hypothetical protein
METMNTETIVLPLDCGDLQEITWSSKLNAFLLLTTDQLYQTNTKHLHPTPIQQIQVKEFDQVKLKKNICWFFSSSLKVLENRTWQLMEMIYL